MRPEEHEVEARWNRGNKWRVDKHVPIAVLFAMMLQTATVVWWASSLTSRVAVLENVAINDGNLAVKLAVVETKLDSLKLDLQDMKNDNTRYNRSH